MAVSAVSGIVPVRVMFPEFGPSLFLRSELTAELRAPSTPGGGPSPAAAPRDRTGALDSLVLCVPAGSVMFGLAIGPLLRSDALPPIERTMIAAFPAIAVLAGTLVVRVLCVRARPPLALVLVLGSLIGAVFSSSWLTVIASQGGQVRLGVMALAAAALLAGVERLPLPPGLLRQALSALLPGTIGALILSYVAPPQSAEESTPPASISKWSYCKIATRSNFVVNVPSDAPAGATSVDGRNSGLVLLCQIRGFIQESTSDHF